jgi:hypothetical protein
MENLKKSASYYSPLPGFLFLKLSCLPVTLKNKPGVSQAIKVGSCEALNISLLLKIFVMRLLFWVLEGFNGLIKIFNKKVRKIKIILIFGKPIFGLPVF